MLGAVGPRVAGAPKTSCQVRHAAPQFTVSVTTNTKTADRLDVLFHAYKII
jgi:hypothetical protein